MRDLASAALAALAAIAVSAQSSTPTERVFSASARTFVTLASLAADMGAADVVFVHEQAGGQGVHRVEMALFEALSANTARRTDVMLAIDVVDRAAQEPLEHFQMGHVSEQELVAEARIPAGRAQAYLPLMKFAVAQAWPIVATGPADAGGDVAASAAIVQAVTMGSAMGKRTLVVSLHAAGTPGVGEKAAAAVRQQLAGRRVLALRMVLAPSLDTLAPPMDVPPGIDYVVYVR